MYPVVSSTNRKPASFRVEIIYSFRHYCRYCLHTQPFLFSFVIKITVGITGCGGWPYCGSVLKYGSCYMALYVQKKIVNIVCDIDELLQSIVVQLLGYPKDKEHTLGNPSLLSCSYDKEFRKWRKQIAGKPRAHWSVRRRDASVYLSRSQVSN